MPMPSVYQPDLLDTETGEVAYTRACLRYSTTLGLNKMLMPNTVKISIHGLTVFCLYKYTGMMRTTGKLTNNVNLSHMVNSGHQTSNVLERHKFDQIRVFFQFYQIMHSTYGDCTACT